MENYRPNFSQYQKTLLFQHDDFPENLYTIMHPTQNTAHSNVVLLPEKPLSENKLLAIPVDKSILVMISYFNGRLNKENNWSENINETGSAFIKLRIPNEFNLEPIDIFKYRVDSLTCYQTKINTLHPRPPMSPNWSMVDQ